MSSYDILQLVENITQIEIPFSDEIVEGVGAVLVSLEAAAVNLGSGVLEDGLNLFDEISAVVEEVADISIPVIDDLVTDLAEMAIDVAENFDGVTAVEGIVDFVQTEFDIVVPLDETIIREIGNVVTAIRHFFTIGVISTEEQLEE